MIKFALLASGSRGNCCLIKDDTTEIIIDCGATKRYLSACFEQLQYDYQKADAMLITHTHSDHIQQLNMFKALPAYSCAPLSRDFHPVQAYDQLSIGDLQIRVLPMSHDCEGTVGYVIESEQEKLVYVTDTGYIRDDVKPYLENADYYIFESNHDIEMLMQTHRPVYVKQRIINEYGHLNNSDSATILSQVIGDRTKEIVLAHISQEGNHRQLASDTLLKQLQKKDLPKHDISVYAAEQFGIYVGGKKK